MKKMLRKGFGILTAFVMAVLVCTRLTGCAKPIVVSDGGSSSGGTAAAEVPGQTATQTPAGSPTSEDEQAGAGMYAQPDKADEQAGAEMYAQPDKADEQAGAETGTGSDNADPDKTEVPQIAGLYEGKHVVGRGWYRGGEFYNYKISAPSSLRPGLPDRITVLVEDKSRPIIPDFESSNPYVAEVSEYGAIDPKHEGTTEITVKLSTGEIEKVTLNVAAPEAKLTFEPTEDGLAYRITGCNVNPYRVVIPAEHDGLPVRELAGDAFTSCDKLYSFETEPGQQYFYAEDGVLYTDIPEKTLVRFPNSYLRDFFDIDIASQDFAIPEDTKAIGDYAFSGLKKNFTFILPEGLTSVGDYVFYAAETRSDVFLPNSITYIGNNILMNLRGNVPFFTEEDSYAMIYAMNNAIPLGIIMMHETAKQTAEISQFSPLPADDYVVPADEEIAVHKTGEQRLTSTSKSKEKIEINGTNKATRVDLRNSWYDILTDENGRRRSPLDPAAGIYGVGYTKEPAVIYGLDPEGNVLGKYEVDKDFVISFDGAICLDIIGGRGIKLELIPYKPIIVTGSGCYSYDPKNLVRNRAEKDLGSFFTIYAGCYVNVFRNIPNHCSFFAHSINPAEGEYDYRNAPEHYFIEEDIFYGSERLDQVGMCVFENSCIAKIYEDEYLEINVADVYDPDPEFADDIVRYLTLLKQFMKGEYFPADRAINRITYNVNGEYPIASESVVSLSDHTSLDDPSVLGTFIHESVHAIDQSIEESHIIPKAWFEGRAEYIAEKLLFSIGMDYGLSYHDFSWSYLSDDEKADFERYYYFGMNRQTPYPVGYLFLEYIIGEYGSDVSARIMAAVDAIGYSHGYYGMLSDEECFELFTDCVKRETSETVFDDFVRDVVNKK